MPVPNVRVQASERALTSIGLAGTTVKNPAFEDRPKSFHSFVANFSRFVRRYNRMSITSARALPRHPEAFVLASNHASLVDAFYLSAALYLTAERDCHWVGWDGAFDKSVLATTLGWLFRNVGITGLDTEPNATTSRVHALGDSMASLETVLASRRPVGIFPEGNHHRVFDSTRPYPFRSGAVYLAAKARVPILPVAIRGTERVCISFGEVHRPVHMWFSIPALFPAKVRVRFGEPIHVPAELARIGAGREREDFSIRLQDEIYTMHSQMTIGAESDLEDTPRDERN
jgi:1-acyl-sn-glycerol-3-phosphate acyltransferase